MNKVKIKDALQDLIIRLQDAEKGYMEIHNAASNPIIKKWTKQFGEQRHEFHKQLEYESTLLGGDPEVRTSFLGDLHRFYIDLKLNNIDDSIPAIVTEIERGNAALMKDYDKVLDLDLGANLRLVLEAQKEKIMKEVGYMVELKDQLLEIE